MFAAFEGLSYTTFETSCAKKVVEMETGPNTRLVLSCVVKNVGKRDGDAVLLLFHRPPQDLSGKALQRPIKRLIDFSRVTVAAKSSSAPIEFSVAIPKQLLLVNEHGVHEKVPGLHVLEIQDGPKYNVSL